MKKRNIITALMAVAVAAFMFSCGGGGGKSPGDTIKAYWKAVGNGDYEKATEYVVKKDGTKLNDEEKTKVSGMISMGKSEFEKNDGYKDIKIIKEEIAEDGKSAKVEFDIIYNNGETEKENQKMLKVDGGWYVPIDN